MLFDWLREVDLDAVPVTHPAQKQALSDLSSAFEWLCDYPVEHTTSDEIEAAQADVREGHGLVGAAGTDVLYRESTRAVDSGHKSEPPQRSAQVAARQ